MKPSPSPESATGRAAGSPAPSRAGLAWGSSAILFLTAAIWGLAFTAQRVGMAHAEPFAFNAARFFLGSLVLLPLVALGRRSVGVGAGRRALVWGGLAGIPLFLGASLQQIGIAYTTAGKAGFITGLYVVLVPLLGILFRQRTRVGIWAGAVLATAGLYLLSVDATLALAPGDALVLAGAVFWAVHVHLIGWLSPRVEALALAAIQFATCGLFSLVASAAFEHPSWSAVRAASLPILYTGVFSVGVAYTLQIIGQRHTHPGPAAIILSLETVFAALGGYLLLGEVLSARQALGCALMLAGMIASVLSEPPTPA